MSKLSPQDKIAKLQTGTFFITYTYLQLKVIFYISPNNFCVIGNNKYKNKYKYHAIYR